MNPGPAPQSHETLLERVEAGDAPALDALLVRHLPSLEAYVRLKAGAAVRARESLGDLVQSVCVEVLRDVERFEYRGETEFRHWLCQQALHKIINKNRFHRAERRDLGRERQKAEDRPTFADCYRTLTPSRVAMGREQWQTLEAAFDQMPDDYREAVTLWHIVGLSYAEIAKAMDRSEGAARNLVYRGIARLSTLMEGESP